jgi:uncharacterized repeat protein (TIGR03803 family)
MQFRPLHLALAVFALLFLPAAHSSAASTGRVLHEFNDFPEGAMPRSTLAIARTGTLYGTSAWDGYLVGGGTVFELIPGPDGRYGRHVIYRFTGGSDGNAPEAGVVLDAAGNLWGTTPEGGKGCGTVFRLTPGQEQWRKTVIYSFRGGDNDGCNPVGGLTIDGKGNIFGTTVRGGPGNDGYGHGTVFMLSKDNSGAWAESVLCLFAGPSDAWFPVTTLAVDAKGRVFGTTADGGANQDGTVFMLMPPASSGGAWSHTILHSFGAYLGDGALPWGAVTLDAAGNLYGTTMGGGTGDPSNCHPSDMCGAVFEVSPTHKGGWSERVLHSFAGSTDGSSPYGGVVFDSHGNLLGTTSQSTNTGGGTVFKLSRGSGGRWVNTTLHDFLGGPDGAQPLGGITIDGEGKLFGTTQYGGAANLGAVFEVRPVAGGSAKERVIFEFPSSDGANPAANVVLDGSNNIYGTTSAGGDCGGWIQAESGCGTVFELSPRPDGGWSRKLLYQLAGTANGAGDGDEPAAGLIFDQSGNLYGTTEAGGKYNEGTVFELTPGTGGGWSEKVLYSFGSLGQHDGSVPLGSLVFDAEGNLYGTTANGGNSTCDFGCGTVFELSPSTNGWSETILYNFTGGSDGSGPAAGLIFDPSGDLYGTASVGGLGYGTIFMLSPGSDGWIETTLYAFTGKNGDGNGPLCTPLFDSLGNLYGTTALGGTNIGSGYGDGTVFELSPSRTGWQEKVLYSFAGGSDGEEPRAGLIFDSSGNLYGTTQGGGNGTVGTVFKLSPSGVNWTESVLWNFPHNGDGEQPAASLVFDEGGTLYGTAEYTLNGNAQGTVFSLKP